MKKALPDDRSLPRLLPDGRVCGELALILDFADGHLCPRCFEAEIRWSELVIRYRARRGGHRLTLETPTFAVDAVRLRDGALIKASSPTVEDSRAHGTILVKGTQVTTHFSNERIPEGKPGRNTTGPGFDFAPLLDDEFAAAFEWEFRARAARVIEEVRTPEELYSRGARFLTFLPTESGFLAPPATGQSQELPAVSFAAWDLATAWKAILGVTWSA